MEGRFLITEYKNKKMAFLFEEERLVKVHFLDKSSIVGNIYTAKVVNKIKSIDAVFLNIGTSDYLYYPLADNENNHIFLRHGNSDKVNIGDEILVQVSKDYIKSKKAEATANINLKGIYSVVNRTGNIGISSKISDSEKRESLKKSFKSLIEEYKDINAGVIVRTAAEKEDIENVLKEAKELFEKMRHIINKSVHLMEKTLVYSAGNSVTEIISDLLAKGRFSKLDIVTDDKSIYENLKTAFSEYDRLKKYQDTVFLKLFEDDMTTLSLVYSLDRAIEKGFARTIHLKSGGSIVVDVTEAMTVIDVNTSKAVNGKNVQSIFLKINKEAAQMIARVIRLRNISGIIIVDFINMKDPKATSELIEYLKSEIARDEIKVNFIDVTGLGLVELTRKKVEKPITAADL
ncbi:MAG: ribonuclease E/G [Eubacterium sp.]|nr:ribonuclease E/G [Eubacterium sp.]